MKTKLASKALLEFDPSPPSRLSPSPPSADDSPNWETSLQSSFLPNPPFMKLPKGHLRWKSVSSLWLAHSINHAAIVTYTINTGYFNVYKMRRPQTFINLIFKFKWFPLLFLISSTYLHKLSRLYSFLNKILSIEVDLKKKHDL